MSYAKVDVQLPPEQYMVCILSPGISLGVSYLNGFNQPWSSQHVLHQMHQHGVTWSIASPRKKIVFCWLWLCSFPSSKQKD